MKHLRLFMAACYLFLGMGIRLKNVFSGDSKLLRVVVERGYLKAVNMRYRFFFVDKLRILVLLADLH
jgi:hypothetical protein